MDITKFMITDRQYLKISHDALPIEKLSTIDGCCEYFCIDIRYVDEGKKDTMAVMIQSILFV